jgi:hypothetical protein
MVVEEADSPWGRWINELTNTTAIMILRFKIEERVTRDSGQ